jgi:glycosyltransferase involved in cell wall biosynthesis
MVVAEALASGVPAVITPSGGPEEIVRTSGAGRVSSGWSARELADGILALLGDLNALTAARKAGRSYVERELTRERFRTILSDAIDGIDG